MNNKPCPHFDKNTIAYALNPDKCVICGHCNDCPYYLDKSCKGCKQNMKPDDTKKTIS
jgi:hypothetical protein